MLAAGLGDLESTVELELELLCFSPVDVVDAINSGAIAGCFGRFSRRSVSLNLQFMFIYESFFIDNPDL